MTASLLVFLFVLLPWIGLSGFYTNNVVADGITASSVVVMTLAIVFSLVSWLLFSWASRNIKFTGMLLSIITGTALILPFKEILGPMAGVLVGLVAGFAAFMIQKRITNPAENKPLIIAGITIVITCAVLFTAISIFQVNHTPHIWDTSDGWGAWTATENHGMP